MLLAQGLGKLNVMIQSFETHRGFWIALLFSGALALILFAASPSPATLIDPDETEESFAEDDDDDEEDFPSSSSQVSSDDEQHCVAELFPLSSLEDESGNSSARRVASSWIRGSRLY